MNNEVIIVLEKFVTNYLSTFKGKITEEMLKNAVDTFTVATESMFGRKIESEEIEQTIANLEQRYAITMDTGTLLKEDNYKKWYQNSKIKRGTRYWDRYYRYLLEDENLPELVVNKIDQASEEIMDVLGDPLSDTSFQRKGLVIGAVQSGKTSNYTALINKAADSGYKVIILLTGTIEKLRQQTQGRIDEGFVGVDSKVKQEKKTNHVIGSGKYDGDLQVVSFTTTAKDFNMKNENVPLKSISDPVIFVIKKNKSILEKLHNWLRIKNTNIVSGKIDMPLLLIDDEADNASVNTNNPDKDPTAINKGIRNLLKLFTKFSYVGFTATPFANIFIDPQIDEETKEDLFPKDFLYLLEQPSNYVGPDAMYHENGEYNYMIRYNDDMEEFLPLKHKNGTTLGVLPNSLEDAILIFFLSNAVRDLRGQNRKHRSMLIHVSRFISVQNVVRDLVDSFVRRSKELIKNYALADEEHKFIAKLKNLFDNEFKGKIETYKTVAIKESWEDVKMALYESVSTIQVRTVNSGTAAQQLNYDEYEDGLRLIAVGGLSLARGLTLEGLTTSYFYRNTKMYDTLMQMGRWFGYRDSYADVCRLWTSEESAGWYAHIANATEELRFEIKKMAAKNMRPIDFGLRVRSSEDAPLIITARNKMKSAEHIFLSRSLNGRMVETAILPSKIREIEANNIVVENWMKHNSQFFVDKEQLGRKKPTMKNVPKNQIIQLLENLDYPYMNEFSKNSVLVSEINKSDSPIFDKWDVTIATNEPKENLQKILFGGIEIYPVERSFDFFGTGHYIRVSKSNKRLGSTDYSLNGLTPEEYKLIKTTVKNILENDAKIQGNRKAKNATQNMYFNTGAKRNPLIVIYPISLKKSSDGNKDIDEFVLNNKQLITGIGIGIPDINGIQNITYEYAINVVYQRELIEGSSKESDWDNDFDDEDPIDISDD